MIFTLTFPIYVGPGAHRNSLMLLFKRPGGGVLLGILGRGVPPDSPNPDPISDQKNVIFHTRFQNWHLKSIPVFTPGGGHKTQHYMSDRHKREIMSSLLRLKPQLKDFLKSISNSHIILSFLFICNCNDETNTLIHNPNSFVNHT